MNEPQATTRPAAYRKPTKDERRALEQARDREAAEQARANGVALTKADKRRLMIHHRRRQAKRGRRPYCAATHRLREIEAVIEARYGPVLPEIDDDAFIVAAAHCLQAIDPNGLDESLDGWCARWAPWALARAGEMIAPSLRSVAGRRYNLGLDKVATLLCVTMEERLALDLRTIGACDLPPKIRKGIMADRKRRLDRERQERKRRADGRQLRADYRKNSISQTKPWIAAGFNTRRTWERHGKPDPVGVVASLSRTGIYQGESDTLATLRPWSVPDDGSWPVLDTVKDEARRPISPAVPSRAELAQGTPTKGQDAAPSENGGFDGAGDNRKGKRGCRAA